MNLIYKEFKQIISNKLFVCTWIVLLCVLCVFMTCDFKAPIKDSSSGAVIGIVNNDTSSYSDIFVNFITNSEEFSKLVKVEVGTKEVIEDKFYAGELDAFIELPNNFIKNIVDIKETPLMVKVSDKDTVTAILVSNVLSAYQKYVSSIQLNVTSLYDHLIKLGFTEKKTELTCFSITYVMVQNVFEKDKYLDTVELSDKKVSSIIVYFTYAAITIVIMYGSLFAGIDILKEKSYWVLNRYLITMGSRLGFILTKVLFYSTALYLLVLVPSVVTSLVNKTKFNYNIMFLYLVFIVTSVCFSVLLCFLLGNINIYALTGNMLYIVSIILGGGIIPIMYMPDKFVKLARFTPTGLFIKSFISVHNNKTLSEVTTVLLICLVVCLISVMLSCHLFGKGSYKKQE